MSRYAIPYEFRVAVIAPNGQAVTYDFTAARSGFQCKLEGKPYSAVTFADRATLDMIEQTATEAAYAHLREVWPDFPWTDARVRPSPF